MPKHKDSATLIPQNYSSRLTFSGVRPYDSAGRLQRIVVNRFTEQQLPFTKLGDILPQDDSSTLFLCSGMQRWKPKFRNPTGERFSTLQTCLRTNDIDEVGDGTHLTSFQMVGNFSFGNGDYEQSVELWTSILTDLQLKESCLVHVHPSQHWHKELWLKRGYPLRYAPDCTWSDGSGEPDYCCELYIGSLEIGNLVNPRGVTPYGHSTDVGFGWERLLQVVSNVSRVDQTEPFDQSLPPVCRDHVRTLLLLHQHQIEPSNKGRGYITRRLIRRCLSHTKLSRLSSYPQLMPWFQLEVERRRKCLDVGRRLWKKNHQQTPQWWWETCGIIPDELPLLQSA